jgi:hypothetical protein
MISEAFKTWFKDPIRNEINEKTSPFIAAIPRKPVTENPFQIMLKYGRNGGLGARTEDGDLPEAGHRMYEQGKAETKNIFGRIALTEKLIRGSQNRNMSFEDQLTTQVEDLTKDAKDYFHRNIMSDHNGVFGIIKTVGTGSPVVLTLDTSQAKTMMQAFYPGQRIDTVHTNTGVVADSGLNIADVDYENGTITLATGEAVTITAAATSGISIQGAYGLELTGMTEILTPNTTIYGVDRSAHKWFNPINVSNNPSAVGTNAVLDPMQLTHLANRVKQNMGSDPDWILCNYGVEEAYEEAMMQYERNIDVQTVKGGHKVVVWKDIPISIEDYFPRNQLACIKTSSDADGEACLYIGQESDWDWMDRDGNVLSRVPNKAAYEATLLFYGELVCEKPGTQGLLTDILEYGQTAAAAA